VRHKCDVICNLFRLLSLPRWFESEPLISKLATDAVTGAMVGPSTPGSGYVLFHHCMGDVGYGRGIWTYVEVLFFFSTEIICSL